MQEVQRASSLPWFRVTWKGHLGSWALCGMDWGCCWNFMTGAQLLRLTHPGSLSPLWCCLTVLCNKPPAPNSLSQSLSQGTQDSKTFRHWIILENCAFITDNRATNISCFDQNNILTLSLCQPPDFPLCIPHPPSLSPSFNGAKPPLPSLHRYVT